MESIQLSALDHSFADFITRIEGVPREGLWIGAALASAVSCRGDVCLELSAAIECDIISFHPESVRPLVPALDEWKKQLATCKAVGQPGEYTPLVLDESGRLYLHRSWDFERRVAEGILERSVWLPFDVHSHELILDRYFPSTGSEIDLQKEAARAALSRRFTVITGGPGTGKTSTVARILALLVEIGAADPPKILLAAPTGKAAMRLKESIRNSIDKLSLSESICSAIPCEVSTIHRLLGVIPGRSGFRFNGSNQLHCDVLVVDEASMVDLPLMARLLEALDADTRIILLGDRDQLSSVEAGAVMADICYGAGSRLTASGAGPAIVELTKSYRFDDRSGIGALSRLINCGDSAGALELLESGKYGDIDWKQLPSEKEFVNSLRVAAGEGYAAYTHATTPSAALKAFDCYRILTPHREGRYGAGAINRQLESYFLKSVRESGVAPFYPAVMITGNNYDLGLYNGDTGVLEGSKLIPGQNVYFPGPDSGLRSFSVLRLPPHESAFAMTVHKSQGSEFDRMLLILPEVPSGALSRELLYTAVTRARSRVEIWGSKEVFCWAVDRRIMRSSGLKGRLWGEVLS